MTKKQVLVIDDNPDIQRLVQIILEELEGWNVLIATSGIEGIALAMQENPDAILLDVMMPILDGIETFKKLQENGKTQKIPTIFLTARVKVNEQEYLSSLGAKGIIVKPFNPDILAQDICNLLDWRTIN